jgi:protein-L-isoaspartate(D-aspartate) O-methyltransferase
LHADGAFGARPFAPFDRIILTVAADDILPAWTEQLAPGGRLVLPLTLNTLQESIAFEGPAPLRSVSIVGTSFVSLRGSEAAAAREITLDPEGAMRLRVRDPGAVDREALVKALLAPPVLVDLEAQLFAVDVWGGLDLWLDAHLDSLALASAQFEDDAVFRNWLSVSAEQPRYAMTLALCDEAGLAFFVRARGDQVRLAVYGAAGRAIERARDAISLWKERGRPLTRRLSITVHPKDERPSADVHVEKAAVTLALRWSR